MKITKTENEAALKIEEVNLRKPIVADLIAAERISGKSQGFEFLAAVVSQVGKFDGKSLLPEDLQRMSGNDFLSLSTELDLVDQPTLPKELSTLSGKEDSGKKE